MPLDVSLWKIFNAEVKQERMNWFKLKLGFPSGRFETGWSTQNFSKK